MNGLRLHQLGKVSWSALGIIALALVIVTGLGAIRGIVLPLIVAVILGTVLEPLVEWLERHGVKHTLAAVIALLVTILLGVGTIVLVVRGFIDQTPEIYRQLTVGWNSFVQWIHSLELDTAWLERARSSAQGYASQLSQGIVGVLGSTFSSLISFFIGTFFALFLLFFMVRDLRGFPQWLARVTRLDPELVDDMTEVAKESLRGYFKGTALTAVLTAPIFVIPLLLLDIPLVIPIVILYFFLSFVPYVGAWITGAFAVLIAFGTGGASAALIIGITFTISNGTIQSAVSSWALGSALNLHPVAVLLATVIGGSIFGLMGMVLGAPIVAAVSKSVGVARAHRASREPAVTDTSPDPPGAPA